MPAFAGLIVGAAANIPVLMAGGTQMCGVLAVVKALDPNVLCNVAIGTTKWVVNDTSADIRGIAAQITNVPILAADLDFGSSKFEGLKAYEQGVVKEGVGAGGAAIAAMVSFEGAVTKEMLLKEIERDYKLLVGKK